MAVHIKPRAKRKFETPPIGVHPGVCSAFIYLGFQERKKEYGKGAPQEKIVLRFEFPTNRYMEDGEDKGPMIMWSRDYTLSLYEGAHLLTLITEWTGTTFPTRVAEYAYDFTCLLGRPGLINVVQNGEYINLGGVTPLMKGMPIPKAELPLLLYDEDNTQSLDVLPDFIRKKIDNQVNPGDWQKTTTLTGNVVADADDETPF